MTKRNQIYKCNICGNIVEVLHEGAGELVCCGQPMELQEERTVDQGKEKHVPVLESKNGELKVKVGEISHPMEESHYIEWIEVQSNGKSFKKFLRPGENPEAIFLVNGENIQARTYCNIHGLWKSN